jgi:glycosyltransferase involved in cell wall biosynthesis
LSDPSQSQAQLTARPKVVRIIARLNVGGAARQVCSLHEKLTGSFETRLIIGCLAPGEQDMSYLLPSDHNVYRLPQMSREVSFWRDGAALWQIFKLLRRERPEIVHTHTAKAGVLGRTAAWLARVPVVVHTYHGHVFYGYFNRTKTRMYLAVERLMGRLSTQVIAVSESQREELAMKYRVAAPEKVTIVHNGFELEHFAAGSRQDARRALGFGDDVFLVAWAGRMVPVKDVQLLASVVRMAAGSQSRICFLIVGDGTDKPALESTTQGCTNIRLLGWREDMAPIWSAADMALLTSRNEGTPTALIEGMAAGLPFVTTDVGGVRDLAVAPLEDLPDGMGRKAANGFLTPRTPEALLYCIERIANDPEAARRMGSAGRAFALATFSVQRQVAEISLLYNVLLARSRTATSVAAGQTKREVTS